MTEETLAKIRDFAATNWNKDPDDPDTVVSVNEEYCTAVTNPWMDSSARFPLDDAGAVKEWGLATVVDFIEKAKEVVQ